MDEKKKVIAVIDLKAFYSYVECVDRGLDPFTTPLVVADTSRGTNTIILSVTPYLKSLGVPSRLRFKELPSGIDYIYATPRMSRYIEKSSEVVSIMMRFVAKEDVHVYSIDEAFIDLTSYLNYYKKTPKEIVLMILDAIKEQTELTATAGIGDNFFLSKVALDIFAKNEKDGIATMHIEDVKEKLWPIKPLTKIWGIGPRTAAKLNELGIRTVGDLANVNRDYFVSRFGIMGDQLIQHANGIDESDVHEEYIPKSHSLSNSQVLFKDYNYKDALLILREMNDDLSTRLRSENNKTDVVFVYVGYAREEDGGFHHQMSLLTYTDDTATLYEGIKEIYNKYIKHKPIRRLGISYGHLKRRKSKQLSLLGDSVRESKQDDLNKVIDSLQYKYGKNILLRASALMENSTTIERHSFIGGHKK